MKYHEIEPMCRPRGGVRGCPHDGNGCTGGERCSINSHDPAVASRAWSASTYGRDSVCHKRAAQASWALRKAQSDAMLRAREADKS